MEARGKTAALVVAAGSGSRTGGALAKQYRQVGGAALLTHAVRALLHPRIDAVQVVIGEGQEADYRQAVGSLPLPAPITGGVTRQFTSFSQLRDDIVEARIWSGIHFRFADTEGAKIGREVAHWGNQHAFR